MPIDDPQERWALWTMHTQQGIALQENLTNAQRLQELAARQYAEAQQSSLLAAPQSELGQAFGGGLSARSSFRFEGMIEPLDEPEAYWRTQMPSSDPILQILAVLKRSFTIPLGASSFKFNFLCVGTEAPGPVVSYTCSTGPLTGYVFTIHAASSGEYAIDRWTPFVVFQLQRALETEWQNHAADWRLEPQGPVRISPEDREFITEQQQFEALPQPERAGLLGP